MKVEITHLHYWGHWGVAVVSAVTEHGDHSHVLAALPSREAAVEWAIKNGHSIADRPEGAVA